MRIIDADALMDDIKRDLKKAIDEGDKVGSFWLGYAAGLVIKLPTIQPEKAQLSQESTTSDLISRTETVERLRGVLDVTVPITDYDGGYVDGVEVGVSTVSAMPTIQPEPTDEQVAEYCKRRCLHIVTDDFFHTVQPERAEGEWVLKDYLWECNKCGCRINVKNPLCNNNWNYYFCPHCGTKMTIAVQRF